MATHQEPIADDSPDAGPLRPESVPSQTTTGKQQDLTSTLHLWTDRLLHFLGTASNETLGACILALSITTYAVLGRLGLLLIGAFGGVVLHATWEGKGSTESDQEIERSRRREVGLDVARRVLEWRSSRASLERQKTEAEAEIAKPADFSRFGPQVAEALNTLTDAVIRDYVRWWYSPVLPTEDTFPAVSRATFSGFVLALASNVSRKRPADSFVEFVTNSSSIVIVFLNELSTALFASPSSAPDDAIQAYAQNKPESSLAIIINDKQQEQKLAGIADEILEIYLDPKVYSCPPARVFLREILAKVVMGMTLDRCSKGEWINEWIVYLLEEGEPELLTAIDAGVEGSNVQGAAVAGSTISSDSTDAEAKSSHQRTKSRAEDAMEDAMREAQRLTALIAEEEEQRQKGLSSQTLNSDDASDSTNTQGIRTPASSQDDPPPDQPLPEEKFEIISAISMEVDRSSPPAPAFTSFDQLAPLNVPTALLDEEITSQPKRQEILTLYKAQISIFDDAQPGDRKALKSKPDTDYMVQIEPASVHFSGWMIARTYADLETLHEVLRRISMITGAVKFTEAHGQLPSWKGRTKAQLTQEFERYLLDALSIESLAESEGMRRFLDKERGLDKSSKAKSAFWAGPAAIETMGKGVFDVLNKAPKNIAGGGKAVLGGVTSVFGVVGGQPVRSATIPSSTNQRQQSVSSSYRTNSLHSTQPSFSSTRTPSKQSVDYTKAAAPDASPLSQSRPSATFGRSQNSLDLDTSRHSISYSADAKSPSPSTPQTPQLTLPPPPSDMPDDYKFPTPAPNLAPEKPAAEPTEPAETDTTSKPTPARRKQSPPMSEKETQVTIELFFAVINELYTLSSAWTLRRTLLNAARTYLLRPGNPQLESIRLLLQESILDTNTSDAGIAAHILKIRENTLPTEDELKKWPKPRSDAEKEKLRAKARKLLVAKGMPQALTSVMGQAASGEALGKVFDCLQIEKVARGLMFGLMLQAVRALTQ